MSDELLRMLRLLAAIHSNRPMMILQRGDVTLLKNSLENGFSALLRNRVMIERRSNLPSSCAKDGNTIVLVSDGEQLWGWCSGAWLNEHQQIIERHDTKQTQKKAQRLVGYGRAQVEEDFGE